MIYPLSPWCQTRVRLSVRRMNGIHSAPAWRLADYTSARLVGGSWIAAQGRESFVLCSPAEPRLCAARARGRGWGASAPYAQVRRIATGPAPFSHVGKSNRSSWWTSDTLKLEVTVPPVPQGVVGITKERHCSLKAAFLF